MPQYDSAKDVINNAAAEVGLTPVADPFASSDPAFVQLCTLLTTAGRELLGLHEWQKLIKEHTFTTTTATEYALPSDFSHMIPQTHWNRTADLPLAGPLSPQQWQHVISSETAAITVYVTFRVQEGVLKCLPDPMVADQEIAFEYVSRNWVLAADGVTMTDKVAASGDTVYFENILIQKFLKLRFLEAKGFDTTAASDQFRSVFMQWTGKDIPAVVLNMASSRGFPYLGYRNIPETNYGL
jgi:hypothetical protein